MNNLSFQKSDPAYLDFQYLEDLSTAYWYSEILFAAIELKLFMLIDQNQKYSTTQSLAKAAGCKEKELGRLLKALNRLNLIHSFNGTFYNSQSAGIYLVPGKSTYLGDFLLYRRYMKAGWETIVQRVSLDGSTIPRSAGQNNDQDDDYEKKLFNYVQAMDILARQKALEIIKLLEGVDWETPALDVGCGAGAVSRALLQSCAQLSNKKSAVLLDLPEVIAAAKKIYPNESDWDGIKTIEGDFRKYRFETDQKFGLILMNNFLHAYDEHDARTLLYKAIDLLKPDGLIVIHDYFPDRSGRMLHKGVLYDVNMMLNTFNGSCHDSSLILEWLQKKGLNKIVIRDLNTDSALMIACRNNAGFNIETGVQEWTTKAVQVGFGKAVLLPIYKIVTGAWVRKKCRFGCAVYGKNLQCPPYGMKSKETEELLNSYKWAILLEGSPPGKNFYDKLLLIEKQAFLAGYHKALVFGAGHCPVCVECPKDGLCRHPEKARPSMEGSGIDVYSTVRNAGIRLKPVIDKSQYVKYIGLLLLE